MPAGSSATTAAPGVMPAQVLGGPVWWFVFGVYLLALGLSLFVTFDSLLPARRERLAALPEPGWLYPGVEGTFALVAIGVWIPRVPRLAAVAPVVGFPFALAVGIAYLLRVVFPKPSEPAAIARTPAETDSASEAEYSPTADSDGAR